MKFKSWLIMTLMIVSGCATASKINRVSVGMTKNEVIDVMGKPVSTSATEGTEYLNYSLSETGDHAFYGITTPYYIRLINGRVDAYGRMGDFDSTKTPTIKIEKEETIKEDASVDIKEKKDMYSELMKLKELKENGIITEKEFENEKNEILNKY